jgi:hypothetical protein
VLRARAVTRKDRAESTQAKDRQPSMGDAVDDSLLYAKHSYRARRNEEHLRVAASRGTASTSR